MYQMTEIIFKWMQDQLNQWKENDEMLYKS